MSKLHEYTLKGATRIKWIIWICIISYFIYSISKHYLNTVIDVLQLNNDYVMPITYSCIFGLLFMLVNKYIWKWDIVNGLLKIPNISGRWKCVGESFKKSSSELQEKGVINVEPQYKWEADINIIQNWTTICIILSKEQSHSESLMAQIEVLDDNCYQLTYVYANTTRPGADTDMRGHEGICKISFTENLASGTGEYFTNPKDRLSYGRIKWIKS